MFIAGAAPGRGAARRSSEKDPARCIQNHDAPASLHKEVKVASFVYTLSKDDVNLAARCFQFAAKTHEKGHQVNVFLFEDGVLWADVTRDFRQVTKTGDCPDDYFPYLVENEITVSV